MILSHLLEKLIEGIIWIGLPVVHAYHLICANIFLNVAAEEAQGIEKIANTILVPTHYLLCGSEAQKESYELLPRFNYEKHFLSKTAVSFVTLPLSLGAGMAVKAIAYLMPETRARHAVIAATMQSTEISPNLDFYRSIGIELGELENAPLLEHPIFTRRPGDENHMRQQKQGLKDIIAVLRKNKIPFWVDCGTLLGTYRYGGIIPWDWDIDIGVLEPDFENIKHALQALDPEKYAVQDWSGRDLPGTYIKVYIKGTGTLIDLYHFAIDPQNHSVRSIFSNEQNPFLPESWKIRERRYTMATAFDDIFPLKRAYFDGVEVAVPNHTLSYLQQRYGQNISPAKVYSAETGQYERDLEHPYWKIPHAR